jgi:hypothetical protein
MEKANAAAGDDDKCWAPKFRSPMPIWANPDKGNGFFGCADAADW